VTARAPRNLDRPGPLSAWLAADPRSLGLGRIGLGVALLCDLALRAPQLTLFYSNAGLLPNHTVLWQPTVPRLFSLFFMVSLPHEATLVFLACGFCFAALAVGYRTRLFQALSLVAAISLHNRIIFVEGEGSVALGALCLWTLFLPLGRRFSVDALRASLRERPDHVAADLDPARAPRAADAPVVSLAVAGLRLQFAGMLMLWFAHRSGAAWRDGTALHLLLHQDRAVTWLGLWAREHLSRSLLATVGRAIRIAPLAIGVLLLLPLLPGGRGRRLGLLVLLGWVGLVAALVNLGNWAAALLAYGPFFLDRRDWDTLVARARRRDGARPATRLLFFDSDCGICFLTARVLRRMDRLGRLRLLANDDAAAFPPGFSVDAGLLERTVLVVDPLSGRRWTRAAAFAEVARVLPGGWPVALLMRLPVVRDVAGLVYDRVAFNRSRISAWFGLAACGVPARAPQAPAPAPPAPPAGGGSWFCRAWRWLREKRGPLRELLAALVLLALAGDAAAVNPPWAQTLVGYTGLFQRWTLWAPDPPRTDRFVFVDAQTADGRHVDPFNAAGSRRSDLPATAIPPRLAESALFAEYARQIPERAVYHQAFIEWVLRHPERTGDARDQIVAFDATAIDDDSPPPGEEVARNARARVFRHWAAAAPP